MTPWSLRDQTGEEATCGRCLETKDATDVDRLFWCRECREVAARRAKARGWQVGGGLAALLALWIWLFVRPSSLIVGGWIAAVVAAFWLLSRIAREVHYGVARYRNRPAVEARPPADSLSLDEDEGREDGNDPPVPDDREGGESEESPWEEER